MSRSKFDMSRMTSAALEAMLADEEPRRRRVSGMRGLAAGAALGVMARVAIRNAPGLPRVPSIPNLSELTDGVRERFAERFLTDEEEPEAEEAVPEEEEPEDEADDEPGDWDDEPDDEGPDDDAGGETEPEPGDEDDEPEGEADEEEEEDADLPPAVEHQSNGQGRAAESATPDVMEALSAAPSPRPAVLRRGRSGRRVDPAARPPEPPQHESEESDGAQ